VLIALAIVVSSLLPGPLIATVVMNDKLDHASAYFLLTVWSTGMTERARYGRVALGAFLLGAAMELAQGWLTTTRQADWQDLAANSGGIALALTAAWMGIGGWAARVEGWLARK